MKRTVLLLAISLISSAGCSTVGDPPAPQTAFRDKELVDTFDVTPVPVDPPVKPTPMDLDGDGIDESVVYTMDEGKRLLGRLQGLNTNNEILEKAAPMVRELEKERRALIEAGRATEDGRNWFAQRAHELHVELDKAKREHLVDNLLHRLIFLLAIAVGL